MFLDLEKKKCPPAPLLLDKPLGRKDKIGGHFAFSKCPLSAPSGSKCPLEVPPRMRNCPLI